MNGFATGPRLVLALSFTLVLDSNTPVLCAVVVLAVVHLAVGRKHRTSTLNAG
jgi:hypothetical protein